MSIAIVNHLRKDKKHYAFSVTSTILTIFLCVIMFWWMVDTVVYLKYEVLKSPLLQSARPRSNLPIT